MRDLEVGHYYVTANKEGYKEQRELVKIQSGTNAITIIVVAEDKEKEDGSVKFIFVNDYSGSMSSQDIEDMETASKYFIGCMSEVKDQGKYIAFGTNVVDVSEVWKSPSELIDDVRSGGASGMTQYYGAIVQALDDFEELGNPGYRDAYAVLAMTDGFNNRSPFNYEEVVIERAVEMGIPIFTIGLGNVNHDILQEIADETGGFYLYSPESHELEAIYEQLATEILAE